MASRAVVIVLTVLMFVAQVVSAGNCEGDTSPELASSAAPAKGPLCVPDTEIFRRTPVIDGKVEEGEWDIFYTYVVDDWSLTTYSDWDSKSFYFAATSNKPFDMMGVLDANADGWFHGDDNYQFCASRDNDSKVALSVLRYESRHTTLPTATPVAQSEAQMVEMKWSNTEGAHAIEMRVPVALFRGLKLAPGKKIGLHILAKTTSDEHSWVPTNRVGDVKDCLLVTKKFATLKPLEMGFDLRESAVARGDTLVGKLHLSNAGTEHLDVHSFVIGGEGKAAAYLSSQRVRVDGIAPKKRISHSLSTLIPKNMPTGSWAIGAEVRSNGKKLGAGLVSFDVLDPFDLEPRMPTGDVRSDVKDVTFAVYVKNNTRRWVSATAKIILPTGWELWRNLDTRSFEISSKGGITVVSFTAKPPLGATGEVPVRIEVTVGDLTKVVEGRLRLVTP